MTCSKTSTRSHSAGSVVPKQATAKRRRAGATASSEGALAKRFWVKVDKGGQIPEHMPHLGQCWEWTAALNTGGYGVISSHNHPVLAHRIAWGFSNGTIPIGLCVCHRCDNRRCCNPKHLFLADRLINNLDRDNKGRQQAPVGEQNGRAKLTSSNIRTIRQLHKPRDPKHGLAGLARRFGVRFQAIQSVVNGRTWSHVK